MDMLAKALRQAQTTQAFGEVVGDAATCHIGLSSFSFLRASGPVVSPSDVFALSGRESPARARAKVVEILPFVDRELEPFARAFASKHKSLDIAERYPSEVVRRSTVFNTLWRPLGVERQLVGFLGTARQPVGFVCVARTSRETAFTPKDLEVFEKIRIAVERALFAAQHLGHGSLDATLAVLSRATPAAWFLFDPAGNLLWLTEEAVARLSMDATRIGSSIALRHSEALERLRAWVRTQARRRDLTSRGSPLACRTALPGEQFVMRRFETGSGKALYLVGFAETRPSGVAGDAPTRETDQRAARLAREHALTPRQRQVLAHLASGKANRVIAAVLGCAEGTVELHVTALLAKTGCDNRAQLVARFWTS